MDRCEPTKPRRAFIGVEGMEQRCKSSTPVVRENVLGYFWPLFRQRLTSHGFWSVSFDVPALFCTFPLWDFTEKTVLLMTCACMSVTEIQSSRAPCKAKKSARSKERAAFLALERFFPIFPSSQGCASHGAKVAFNETLEVISEEMQMPRPKSERVVDPKKPPHGLVLKREYSDAGLDGQIATTKDIECFWLAQEYVPFPPIVEFRFICVGGVPIREVVTGKHEDHPVDPGGLWAYDDNHSLKTVLELQ